MVLFILKKKEVMDHPNETTDYLQSHSYANHAGGMPQGLNVLTILSFIGNGVQIIGSIIGYFLIDYSVKQAKQMTDMEKEPALKGMSGFFKLSADATIKQYEHRVLLLVVGLIASAICIYGVWQMRQYKKQGFVIYAAGEFALPLVTVLLVGWFSAVFGLFIAVLFTLLFNYQRKYLK